MNNSSDSQHEATARDTKRGPIGLWVNPVYGLLRSKQERALWKRVSALIRAGKPIPKLSDEDSKVLAGIFALHKDLAAKLDERDVAKFLSAARAWSYAHTIGFRRREALPHPDMLAWARINFLIAQPSEWIAEAQRCHKARPIRLEGYDTLPITQETLGRPVKIKAEASERGDR